MAAVPKRNDDNFLWKTNCVHNSESFWQMSKCFKSGIVLELVKKTSGYTYGHCALLFSFSNKHFTINKLEFVLEKTYTLKYS